jgi:hypothetical protein
MVSKGSHARLTNSRTSAVPCHAWLLQLFTAQGPPAHLEMVWSYAGFPECCLHLGNEEESMQKHWVAVLCGQHWAREAQPSTSALLAVLSGECRDTVMRTFLRLAATRRSMAENTVDCRSSAAPQTWGCAHMQARTFCYSHRQFSSTQF